MLIVDTMEFASKHPGARIVLIAGDRDYCYLVSRLRHAQHEVVVITPEPGALAALASTILLWQEVLQLDDKGNEGPRLCPASRVDEDLKATYALELKNLGIVDAGSVSGTEPCHPHDGREISLIQSWQIVEGVDSKNDSQHLASEAVHSPHSIELSNHSPRSGRKSPEQGLDMPLPLSRVSATESVKLMDDENEEHAPETLTHTNVAPPSDNPSVEDAPSDSPELDPAVVAKTYRSLIRVLNCFSVNGDPRPSIESVKSFISWTAFRAANTEIWDEYVQLAKDQAVIDVGDDSNGTWVGLRPAFRRGSEHAFRALVEVLKGADRKRVLRSVACDMLIEREGRDFFERHGFNRWSGFAAQAEDAGYVVLGEKKGKQYVTLTAGVL